MAGAIHIEYYATKEIAEERLALLKDLDLQFDAKLSEGVMSTVAYAGGDLDNPKLLSQVFPSSKSKVPAPAVMLVIEFK